MDNQRINIWERKLLDLTMGNALINTKYGANCMQAVEQDAVPVVEHLMHSEHLTLLPAENPAVGLHFPLSKEPLQYGAAEPYRRTPAGAHRAQQGTDGQGVW